MQSPGLVFGNSILLGIPIRAGLTSLRLGCWLAALFLLVPWQGVQARTGPLVLTEKDTGRTIALRVGEHLVLDLRNPASGGYTEISPDYDPAVLQLVSRKPVPPEPGAAPRLGDFGRIILEWQAANPGETELVIHIARRWEKDKNPLVYVKLRVRVSAR